MKKPKKKYDSLQKENELLTKEIERIRVSLDSALNIICTWEGEAEQAAINFLMDSRKK